MKKILKEKFNNKKAITLIALVITIVVLIILAAVAINLTVGENGIISRAKEAKELYETKANEEAVSLASYDDIIERLAKALNGTRGEGEITTDEVNSLINQAIEEKLESAIDTKLAAYAKVTDVETLQSKLGFHTDTIYSGTAQTEGTYNFTFPQGKSLSSYKYLIVYGKSDNDWFVNNKSATVNETSTESTIIPASIVTNKCYYTISYYTNWWIAFSIPNGTSFRIDSSGASSGIRNQNIFRIDGIL